MDKWLTLGIVSQNKKTERSKHHHFQDQYVFKNFNNVLFSKFNS